MPVGGSIPTPVHEWGLDMPTASKHSLSSGVGFFFCPFLSVLATDKLSPAYYSLRERMEGGGYIG